MERQGYAGSYRKLLGSLKFEAYLWTQFLGAFNDNLYKIVLSLIAVDISAKNGGGSGYLSLVGVVFIFPFLIFSGYSGYLCDVYSKRTVIVVSKSLEAAAMLLAVFALISGSMPFMLSVLFLMALQSTFFSPAKYGIIPEMLPDRDISRANGLLEMTTFLAILLGTSAGSFTYSVWKEHLQFIGFILSIIAAAGVFTSLGVERVPPSGSTKKFEANPFGEISKGIKRLHGNKSLFLTVIGISYFWFFGALLQMDVLLLGKEAMGLGDLWIGLLITFLAIGIGLGSIAAGRLSGDNVELGLVPLGSIGIAVFSIILSRSGNSYPQASTALAMLGFSGGLFIVPLNAYLQQKSGRQEKGRLIATNNFLNMSAILLASGALWSLHDIIKLSSASIILLFGILTIAATIYILTVIPDFLVRFILWLFTHTVYRIRIVGEDNIPLSGPALLVSNHVSFADGLLISACIQRFVRFMIHRDYYDMKILNRFFRLMKAIPVSGKGRKDVVESINMAREELSSGHLVCIFPEGAITRTGNLLPFKRGVERIVKGMDVPIIPLHLDRVWGSIFSFKGGRFFFKRPERIPYPITVSFGSPMPSKSTAADIRQAVMELSGRAFSYRRNRDNLLHLHFLRTAKRRWGSIAIIDSTGQELTFGSLLVVSMILSGLLEKNHKGEEMMAILFPTSAGGALTNIAALMAGKVPVNLNFTVGKDAMEHAISRCNIKTIITSKKFLKKAGISEMKGMAYIYIEDMLKGIGMREKMFTAIKARLLPYHLLRSLFQYGDGNPNGLATVIFTSGSTGAPKGVMLSHHNIFSNIEGFSQILRITKDDKLMGVLPFFHSFGFTAGLWFPIIAGLSAIYHPNPLDARKVCEMISKYRATIMIGTPTFYNAYLKRASKGDLCSIRLAIAGAEKLHESTIRTYKEKHGIDMFEGYGCTETGPVVSLNIPDHTSGNEHQTGRKIGTVGHPIPGVMVKVVDPDSGKRLPHGEDGLLLVKGPNVMLGYLYEPEKTRKVLKDGWYITGDIASIDEDGFIKIVDRLSRFSKIGGEMVPHIKIEEAVNSILASQSCVVTSVQDEKKGERIVVLYTDGSVTSQEIWAGLKEKGIPPLWLPDKRDIYRIDEIPTLGTGKVDLKRARQIAEKKYGSKFGS